MKAVRLIIFVIFTLTGIKAFSSTPVIYYNENYSSRIIWENSCESPKNFYSPTKMPTGKISLGMSQSFQSRFSRYTKNSNNIILVFRDNGRGLFARKRAYLKKVPRGRWALRRTQTNTGSSYVSISIEKSYSEFIRSIFKVLAKKHQLKRATLIGQLKSPNLFSKLWKKIAQKAQLNISLNLFILPGQSQSSLDYYLKFGSVPKTTKRVPRCYHNPFTSIGTKLIPYIAKGRIIQLTTEKKSLKEKSIEAKRMAFQKLSWPFIKTGKPAISFYQRISSHQVSILVNLLASSVPIQGLVEAVSNSKVNLRHKVFALRMIANQFYWKEKGYRRSIRHVIDVFYRKGGPRDILNKDKRAKNIGIRVLLKRIDQNLAKAIASFSKTQLDFVRKIIYRYSRVDQDVPLYQLALRSLIYLDLYDENVFNLFTYAKSYDSKFAPRFYKLAQKRTLHQYTTFLSRSKAQGVTFDKMFQLLEKLRPNMLAPIVQFTKKHRNSTIWYQKLRGYLALTNQIDTTDQQFQTRLKIISVLMPIMGKKGVQYLLQRLHFVRAKKSLQEPKVVKEYFALIDAFGRMKGPMGINILKEIFHNPKIAETGSFFEKDKKQVLITLASKGGVWTYGLIEYARDLIFSLGKLKPAAIVFNILALNSKNRDKMIISKILLWAYHRVKRDGQKKYASRPTLAFQKVGKVQKKFFRLLNGRINQSHYFYPRLLKSYLNGLENIVLSRGQDTAINSGPNNALKKILLDKKVGPTQKINLLKKSVKNNLPLIEQLIKEHWYYSNSKEGKKLRTEAFRLIAKAKNGVEITRNLILWSKTSPRRISIYMKIAKLLPKLPAEDRAKLKKYANKTVRYVMYYANDPTARYIIEKYRYSRRVYRLNYSDILVLAFSIVKNLKTDYICTILKEHTNREIRYFVYRMAMSRYSKKYASSSNKQEVKKLFRDMRKITQLAFNIALKEGQYNLLTATEKWLIRQGQWPQPKYVANMATQKNFRSLENTLDNLATESRRAKSKIKVYLPGILAIAFLNQKRLSEKAFNLISTLKPEQIKTSEKSDHLNNNFNYAFSHYFKLSQSLLAANGKLSRAFRTYGLNENKNLPRVPQDIRTAMKNYINLAKMAFRDMPSGKSKIEKLAITTRSNLLPIRLAAYLALGDLSNYGKTHLSKIFRKVAWPKEKQMLGLILTERFYQSGLLSDQSQNWHQWFITKVFNQDLLTQGAFLYKTYLKGRKVPKEYLTQFLGKLRSLQIDTYLLYHSKLAPGLKKSIKLEENGNTIRNSLSQSEAYALVSLENKIIKYFRSGSSPKRPQSSKKLALKESIFKMGVLQRPHDVDVVLSKSRVRSNSFHLILATDSSWCGHCIRLEKTIYLLRKLITLEPKYRNNFKETLKAKFFKFKADFKTGRGIKRRIKQLTGVTYQGIPTFFVFKNGRLIKKFSANHVSYLEKYLRHLRQSQSI